MSADTSRHPKRMIDVETEKLINFATACKHPALKNDVTGRPCHPAQLYRYVKTGARSANGERVRLETVRTPRGMRTTREAIARFIAALTEPDRPAPTPRARTKEIAAMERDELELAAMGFDVGNGGPRSRRRQSRTSPK